MRNCKMMFNAPYDIKKYDVIVIEAQGIRVVGQVLNVDYWGDDGGWHIEMSPANVPGNYSFWKQREDGGKIVKINDKIIEY